METSRYRVRIDRKEICYFRYTLESYDGMAVVTTIDPHEALIEIRVSPGCEGLLFELLSSLVKLEGMKIELCDGRMAK